MRSSNFAFRGYGRKVARSIVAAMVPRWDDFPVDITDEVLEQVEDFARHYPPAIRLGVMAMFMGLELSPALVGEGLRPLSFRDRESATRVLEKVANSPLPPLRMMVLLPKIMVSFSAYSRPDVEGHLGVRRRAWRENRKRFREHLIQIDEGRAPPPTPEPLCDGAVARESYLDFGEAS
jgi:hypothetical protein